MLSTRFALDGGIRLGGGLATDRTLGRSLRLALGFAWKLAGGLAGALALGAAPVAALSTVQDQSDLDLTGAFAISSFLAADDLNFPAACRPPSTCCWSSRRCLRQYLVLLDGFLGRQPELGDLQGDDSGPADSSGAASTRPHSSSTPASRPTTGTTSFAPASTSTAGRSWDPRASGW